MIVPGRISTEVNTLINMDISDLVFFAFMTAGSCVGVRAYDVECGICQCYTGDDINIAVCEDLGLTKLPVLPVDFAMLVDSIHLRNNRISVLDGDILASWRSLMNLDLRSNPLDCIKFGRIDFGFTNVITDCVIQTTPDMVRVSTAGIPTVLMTTGGMMKTKMDSVSQHTDVTTEDYRYETSQMRSATYGVYTKSLTPDTEIPLSTGGANTRSNTNTTPYERSNVTQVITRRPTTPQGNNTTFIFAF